MTKTERIERSIRKNPDAPDWRIAKNLAVTVAEVREVRPDVDSRSVTVNGDAAGGVCLRNKRVLSRKPAETASKFIKRLPKQKGFSPLELSQEWGIAEDTIRRHARDLGCLRFVEIEEDEWQQLVLHPETAKRFTT